MKDLAERLAVAENNIMTMKDVNLRIFEKLDAIHAFQSKSKTDLMSCKDQLEHDLRTHVKENYLSIPAADQRRSDMNHRFNLMIAWMGGFTAFGVSAAWAINFFNLV